MGSSEAEEGEAGAGFEPLPEGAVAALDDEELVDYIARAGEAGDTASARTASGILAFGKEPTIVAWVRKDMGSQSDEDIEDVVGDVLYSVVHSNFEGKLVGEFGAFLKTITKRRVVDYFRKRERRDRDEQLPSEHEGDDDVWADKLGVEDDTELIAIRDAVERVLSTRQGMHQKVIRLYGPGYIGGRGLSAEETAIEIADDDSEDTVTSANVHQIWKRFKTDLAKELELDG